MGLTIVIRQLVELVVMEILAMCKFRMIVDLPEVWNKGTVQVQGVACPPVHGGGRLEIMAVAG